MKNCFILFLLVIVASCSDPCEDVLCGDNGVCDEGVCICDTGVYGDKCSQLYRDDFLGTWAVSDLECNIGNSATSAVLTFSAGTNVDEFQITSSITPDLLLVAKVDSISFVIEDQIIFFGVDVNYSGAGSLNSPTEVTLDLTQKSEGQDDRICTFQLRKN